MCNSGGFYSKGILIFSSICKDIVTKYKSVILADSTIMESKNIRQPSIAIVHINEHHQNICSGQLTRTCNLPALMTTFICLIVLVGTQSCLLVKSESVEK